MIATSPNILSMKSYWLLSNELPQANICIFESRIAYSLPSGEVTYMERKPSLISVFAASLAGIAAEGAVRRWFYWSSVCVLQGQAEPSLLCDKRLTSWHNVLSSATVAFNVK